MGKKKTTAVVSDQDIRENSFQAAEALMKMEKMVHIPTVYPGQYFNFKFDKLTLTNVLRWELSVFLLEPIEMFETDYNCSFILDPRGWEAQINSTIEDFKNPQGDLFQGYPDPQTYIDKINRIHSDYSKESVMFGHFDFEARLAKYEEKEYSRRQIKFIVPDTLVNFFRTRKSDLFRFALLFRHESIVEETIMHYSNGATQKIADALRENWGTAYLWGKEVSTEEFVNSANPSELAVLWKVADKINEAKIRSPLPPEKE